MARRSDLVAFGAAAALGVAALIGAWWALAPAPLPSRAEAVLAAEEPLAPLPEAREARAREDFAARSLERRIESESGPLLEVLVRDGDTGAPVSEAQVSLWIEEPAPAALAPWRSRLAWPASRLERSARDGRAWLRTPERAGLAFVRAVQQRADGSWLAETAVVDAAQERLEIELRPARLERRAVLGDGCAAPAASPSPGPALALSRHGSWSWRVFASWVGTSELEILAPAELSFDALFAFSTKEGLRLARVEGFGADAATPRAPALLRAPRELRVRARDEAGAPRAELALRARQESELGVRIGGITDAQGEVALGSFFGGAVALGGDLGAVTVELGTYDLERGTSVAEVVLPAPRVVRLAPRGLAALPALERVRWVGATALGEPEALADAWRMRLLPSRLDAPLRLELAVEGCVPCELELALPPREREERIEVELVREAELAVEVLAPEDGVADVELQRARAGEQGWDPVGRRPWLRKGSAASAENGAAPLRFAGLRPGRYRAIDRVSGAASAERELRGGEERELLLDLRAARWAHVRVAIPEGYRRELLRLDVEQRIGDGWRSAARCEVRATAEGFDVRVPGDCELRVVAQHPRLVARDAGRGLLRSGFEELSLVLEAGAELRFRIARELRTREVSLRARREGESTWRAVRVLGWRSESHRVLALEPGTYDLCFEVARHLPVVLRAQRITVGELDLGELRFERGGAVQAVVRDPEAGEGRSFLYELELQEAASEAELGREPRRVRSGLLALDDEELELDGLGAGTWRVELRRREMWSTESRALSCAPRELALDGRGVHELVLEVGAAR